MQLWSLVHQLRISWKNLILVQKPWLKDPIIFSSSFVSRLPDDMYHVMLNRSNIRTSLCETSSRHGQAEGGGGEGHREEVDEGGVGGLIGKTPTHLSCLYCYL